MNAKPLLAGFAALLMGLSPVLAQTVQPSQPSAPAAPAPARPAAPAAAQPATPATPARPAAPAAAQPAAAQPAPAATTPARPTTATTAPAAVGQRVNLNTAAQADLDKLPQIGEARAKAILAERAKGRFTNWDNFVQRMQGSAVNQTAKDAIKDRVSF
jgi:DNA uptake protein ComE-like DNA-binding protein